MTVTPAHGGRRIRTTGLFREGSRVDLPSLPSLPRRFGTGGLCTEGVCGAALGSQPSLLVFNNLLEKRKIVKK